MSPFNRRSSPDRQLQLGLLSRTIFSAQPINGALKHTAQNTIPGDADCGGHTAVLKGNASNKDQEKGETVHHLDWGHRVFRNEIKFSMEITQRTFR